MIIQFNKGISISAIRTKRTIILGKYVVERGKLIQKNHFYDSKKIWSLPHIYSSSIYPYEKVEMQNHFLKNPYGSNKFLVHVYQKTKTLEFLSSVHIPSEFVIIRILPNCLCIPTFSCVYICVNRKYAKLQNLELHKCIILN